MAWYESECKDIYDVARNNNVIQQQASTNSENDTAQDSFEIKNANCLSINNNKHLNNIDKGAMSI